MVQPNIGVQIHYIYYWSDAFRDPEVEKTYVAVRYDPFDAGIAYAFVKGHWVTCISEYYSRFKGRSEQEMKLAMTELCQRHRQHRRRFNMTARRLAEFLDSLEAEEILLERRLRDGAGRRTRSTQTETTISAEQDSLATVIDADCQKDSRPEQLTIYGDF